MLYSCENFSYHVYVSWYTVKLHSYDIYGLYAVFLFAWHFVVIDHSLITKLAYVGSPVFFCLRGTCKCYQHDSNAVSNKV